MVEEMEGSEGKGAQYQGVVSTDRLLLAVSLEEQRTGVGTSTAGAEGDSLEGDGVACVMIMGRKPPCRAQERKFWDR